MKKLLKFLAKIHIQALSIIVYSLAFLTGRFVPLFIYFFITSIHELSHCLIAIVFKLKINKIEVYPFGLSMNIDSLNKIHPFKSILILLAGPCSFFISQFIINLMFNYDIISYNTYLYSIETNKLILLFNLLPIWPLDGSKIIFYLLSFITPLKKCYYLVISISFLTTISLVVLTFNDPQLVIITFLIFSQIELIIKYQFEYYRTLLYRLNNNVKYKLKLHDKKDIYLPYKNCFFNDIIFLDEDDLILNILNQKKE